MGEAEFIVWSVQPALWAAVGMMSVLSSYVAFALGQRVLASPESPVRWLWLSAGALALGSGIWSSHFVGLADDSLPFGVGYGGALTFAGWLLAVVLSALSLVLGLSAVASQAQRATAAMSMALAVFGAEFLCFLDMHMAPAIAWRPVWVAAALLLGAVGAAAAYATLRFRAYGPFRRVWHAGSALVLGLALAGAHFGSMLAAQVSVDAVSLTHLVSVSSGMLAILAALGTAGLLGLLMVVSVIEARMERQLQQAVRKIDEAARTDALTGLPNRAHFDERLGAAAAAAYDENRSIALAFVSLDGFKPVNDSFGRTIGDLLLQQLALRLQAVAGPGDTVARVGGDEFALLAASPADKGSVSVLAQRLLTELGEPCDLEGRQVIVSCSIGLVICPQHGGHTSAMRHAEAAAGAAKRSGGATYAFFEQNMLSGVSEQLDLLRDLRVALSKRQLELYYQPKIHAPSGEITGAEALLRWHHPQRGMISPGVFIPIAERYGLIGTLGNWVIDEACGQARAWRDQGLRMRVAINLSVHQLRHPDLAERIADALRRHQINPTLLTCEITESVAMEDPQATMKIFETLARVGVRISIDDFGTGYSSLAYLRKLPAEELKIDRSFVLDLETSSDARAVVDAVVKLAQALGLKVVAEGVETDAQNQILRSLGCDELQGYLFAKPMSAKALALWAMNDDGPRALEFRDSLFKETAPMALR